MSINSEINRISQAKSTIKAAIEAKSGSVIPASTKIDSYSVYIDSINSGGSSENNDVLYIDYNGDTLYAYSKEDFLELSSHPSNPDHTLDKQLLAQGWNWTLADAKDYVNKYGGLVIGQMYTTTDGATRLTIDTTLCPDYCFSNQFQLNISQTKSYGTTIDWGDGTPTTTVQYTGNRTAFHQYDQPGIYTIKFLPDDDCVFGFYGHIFGNVNYSISRASEMAITSINIGDRYQETLSVCAFKNLQELTIANTVTTITTYTFTYNKLTGLVLPNSITTLLAQAFGNCTSLRQVSLPNSLISIGQEVFTSANLENIYIPDSVTEIGANAFAGALNAKNIIIGSGVTSLGTTITSNGNFEYAYICQKLIIGTSNITFIPKNTFINMYTIENISIPNNVLEIGVYAFQNCFRLKTLTLSNKLQKIYSAAFNNCNLLESLTLPTTITTIMTSAFRYCYRLKTINFPSSLSTIEEYAFYQCWNLESIDLSQTQLTTIPNSAFLQCYKATTIMLPNTLTTIEINAFSNPECVRSLVIPNSVTSIGDAAFNNCYSLETLTLSNQLTTIPLKCFTNANALIELTIPDSVITIEQEAFNASGTLKILTIGSGVTSIGASAFAQGNLAKRNLQKIIMKPTTPPTIQSNTFNGHTISDGFIIEVPAGCLSAYQNASNWSTYASIMVESAS